MSEDFAHRVAIVDYGMGNLFSVRRACESVGIPAAITSSPAAVAGAGGVVLPGVGAFGVAIATLRDLGLDQAIIEAAARGVPILGVCLGMQLLFDRSCEFGDHAGLGVLRGTVVPLVEAEGLGQGSKVPHVGWSPVRPVHPNAWDGTPLQHLAPGAFQYFVHSFYAKVTDGDAVLSVTPYGGAEFCSSVRHHSILACQFHPERSGREGLQIYRDMFKMLAHSNQGAT